jgi:hypothetical protein
MNNEVCKDNNHARHEAGFNAKTQMSGVDHVPATFCCSIA